MLPNKIKNSYTKFARELSKYSIGETLFFIWNLSNYLTFDKPFPIQLPGMWTAKLDPLIRTFLPHEQEFIIHEALLHCKNGSSIKSIKDISNISVLQKLIRKDLVEAIEKTINLRQDFGYEMNRMFHKQLFYQTENQIYDLYRAKCLFSFESIENNIFDKTGLSIFKINIIGLNILMLSSDGYRIKLPLKSGLKNFSNEDIDKFIETYSSDINTLRGKVINNHSTTESLFYSNHEIIFKPIIRLDDSIVIPIHQLLIKQISSGLYYLIDKEKGFNDVFGKSFENYTGNVLRKCCTKSKFNIIEEISFQTATGKKKTTDWTLIEGDQALFIECKTKRLTHKGKFELIDREYLEKDYGILADGIVQLFKNIKDYKLKKSPIYSINSNLEIYPILVTLENWFIEENLMLRKMFDKIVNDKLISLQFSTTEVESFNYSIKSIEAFETDSQVINHFGIKKYVESFHKEEYQELKRSIPIQYPFKKELNEYLISSLEDK